MARFKIDLRASAFRSVLGFTAGHWRRQPLRLSLISGAFLLSTLADVLTPLYSGRLVDAVASSAGADDALPGDAVDDDAAGARARVARALEQDAERRRRTSARRRHGRPYPASATD